MNTLIVDFKNGVSLCFIGISNQPAPITSIKEVTGGYKIACDKGESFAVTADKIFYSKTV